MQTEHLELAQIIAKGNNLLSRSRQTLSDSDDTKRQALSQKVPEGISPSSDSVKLVFAGQYSAGKSSIIQMLTGRTDIAIGGGITTQEAQAYSYNGITIMDTPGVHTKLRPDHDEITYKAIADSDLLVFVVTNELFDSHIADHFRKLAIDRDKANEMMLVVNKMQRCAQGNSREAQDVIREDLRKVLTPFTPEELRTSFIDASYALESKTETDREIAALLLEKSGFSTFTQELNKFIREKVAFSKYTTALYVLEQILQEALSCEASDDKDIAALELMLLQRRHALMDTQASVLQSAKGETSAITARIRQDGQNIADMIHASASQDEVNHELQLAQERAQDIVKKLEQTLQKDFAKHLEGLDARITALANSTLSKELFSRLAQRIKKTEFSPGTIDTLKKTSDISSQLGRFLVQNSFKPGTGSWGGIFSLRQYSGTPTHEVIKSLGKFFGKSFKPWEAVKLTRVVANIGRGLAVVGTVFTIALQIKEDADAAQLEKDLRENRSEVRAVFNNAAHEIEMHFDKVTQTFIAETLSPSIAEVDAQLDDLRNMQQTRDNQYQNILDLLQETRDLIKKIHSIELQGNGV